MMVRLNVVRRLAMRAIYLRNPQSGEIPDRIEQGIFDKSLISKCKYIRTLYYMNEEQVETECKKYSLSISPVREKCIFRLINLIYAQQAQESPFFKNVSAKETSIVFNKNKDANTQLAMLHAMPFKRKLDYHQNIALLEKIDCTKADQWDVNSQNIHNATTSIVLGHSQEERKALQSFIFNVASSSQAQNYFEFIIENIAFMADSELSNKYNSIVETLKFSEINEISDHSLFSYLQIIAKDQTKNDYSIMKSINQLSNFSNLFKHDGILALLANYCHRPEFPQEKVRGILKNTKIDVKIPNIDKIIEKYSNSGIISDSTIAIQLIKTMISPIDKADIESYLAIMRITKCLYYKLPCILDSCEDEMITFLATKFNQFNTKMAYPLSAIIETSNIFNRWYKESDYLYEYIIKSPDQFKSVPANIFNELAENIHYRLKNNIIFQSMHFSKKCIRDKESLSTNNTIKLLHNICQEYINSDCPTHIFDGCIKLLSMKQLVNIEYADTSILRTICQIIDKAPSTFSNEETIANFLKAIHNLRPILDFYKIDYATKIKDICFNYLQNPVIAYYFLKLGYNIDRANDIILESLLGNQSSKDNDWLIYSIACCNMLSQRSKSAKLDSFISKLFKSQVISKPIEESVLQDCLELAVLHSVENNLFISFLQQLSLLEEDIQISVSEKESSLFNALQDHYQRKTKSLAPIIVKVINKSKAIYNKNREESQLFKPLTYLSPSLLSNLDNQNILDIMALQGRHTFYNYSIDFLGMIIEKFHHPTKSIQLLSMWPSFLRCPEMITSALELCTNNKLPIEDKFHLFKFLCNQNISNSTISSSILANYLELSLPQFEEFLQYFSTYGTPLSAKDTAQLMHAVKHFYSSNKATSINSLTNAVFLLATSSVLVKKSEIQKWLNTIEEYYAYIPTTSINVNNEAYTIKKYTQDIFKEVQNPKLMVSLEQNSQQLPSVSSFSVKKKLYERLSGENKLSTEEEILESYFQMISNALPDNMVRTYVEPSRIESNDPFFKYLAIADVYNVEIPNIVLTSVLAFTDKTYRIKFTNGYKILASKLKTKHKELSKICKFKDYYTSDINDGHCHWLVLGNDEVFSQNGKIIPIRIKQHILNIAKEGRIKSEFICSNWSAEEIQQQIDQLK